jgi:predicted outer membrane repeat protein
MAANCTIEDNTAGVDGGGLNAGGTASVDVSHTVFLRNRAVKGAAADLNGRAVVVDFKACTFRGNDARDFGGAVDVVDHSHMSATSCAFHNNSAGTTGGAISMADSGSVVLAGKTQGVGNRAKYGGFLGLEGNSHAEVLGATFARNVATDQGGNARGGCFYERDNAVAVVHNSTIVGGDEQPGVKGGGFGLIGNATLFVSSCTLSHLHAAQGAGIYASGTSSVHARDVRLIDTTAADFGGGLFASTYGRVTWVGGSFVRTNARVAGAIDVMDGSLIVAGTRFENCSSSNGGGCVYAEAAANASFTDCTMRGCTAVNDGGGACYVTNIASVRFERCNITNSRSVSYGGGALAIFRNGSVHMHNCRLEQNQGATVGGAVAAQDHAQFTAVDCMVFNNSCADRGGGLGLNGNASAQLTQCLVSGCLAKRAGGVSLQGQASVSLVDTVITRNTAASFGGGALLGSDGFELLQMRAAVHDNMAPAQADLAAVPLKLASNNSSTVWNYTSRLRADEGLLHVVLLVSGPHGLPAASVDVNAVLDDVAQHTTRSGNDGLVHFAVKLLKPPGTLCLDMVSCGSAHEGCSLHACMLVLVVALAPCQDVGSDEFRHCRWLHLHRYIHHQVFGAGLSGHTCRQHHSSRDPLFAGRCYRQHRRCLPDVWPRLLLLRPYKHHVRHMRTQRRVRQCDRSACGRVLVKLTAIDTDAQVRQVLCLT